MRARQMRTRHAPGWIIEDGPVVIKLWAPRPATEHSEVREGWSCRWDDQDTGDADFKAGPTLNAVLRMLHGAPNGLEAMRAFRHAVESQSVSA